MLTMVAWATLLLALATLWLVKVTSDLVKTTQQNAKGQLDLQAQEIKARFFLQLTERFQTDRVRNCRAALASVVDQEDFITGSFVDCTRWPDATLLDLFSTAGHLLEQKLLDDKLCWYEWRALVIPWWAICEAYIRWVRETAHAAGWQSGFETLADRVLEIESQTTRSTIKDICTKWSTDPIIRREFLAFEREQRVAPK
jgi:hypothetical protein